MTQVEQMLHRGLRRPRRRVAVLGLLASGVLTVHIALLEGVWKIDVPPALAPTSVHMLTRSVEPAGAALPGAAHGADRMPPTTAAQIRAAPLRTRVREHDPATSFASSSALALEPALELALGPALDPALEAAPDPAPDPSPARALSSLPAAVTSARFGSPQTPQSPRSAHAATPARTLAGPGREPVPADASRDGAPGLRAPLLPRPGRPVDSDTRAELIAVSLSVPPSGGGAPPAPRPPDRPSAAVAGANALGPGDLIAAADVVAAASATAAASRAVDEGEAVPVYPTRMPPAVTLQYELRSGMLGGTGELQWRPTAQGYSMRLSGRAVGLNVLTQVSEGGFDAAGLAPLRFTDQRLKGAAQAANFRRDLGVISYSGPSLQHALLAGTQDRLSWMAQLAAVLEAEPEKAPLQRVVFRVSDARGDLSVWSFVRIGADTVPTGLGPKATVKYMREATDAHDARVEVWVDPAQHHMPARAVLRNAKGQGFELLLQSSSLP